MLKAETTNSKIKEQQNLEWLKDKLATLWTVPKYCGLCLESTGNFYSLAMEFAINECYSTQPLREIVTSILCYDIEEYATSEVICELCTEKTILAYIFIENTKKVLKILSNCVNDLLSKVTDLDNELEENNKYEDANVMVVVECDSEIYRNINELNTLNNIILTDKPVTKLDEHTMHHRESVLQSKNKLIEKPKEQNKENKGPIIIPTARVIKHPRTKETNTASKEEKPTKNIETPTVSLEGGKIVIAPLITNTPSAIKFNTYKCNSCPSIFTTYRSLKEHEKTLHNTTVYQCRFCSKKYNSQQSLDIHYTATHSKSRCRHCYDLFDNNEFNSHLRENHTAQVNSCKFCDLVYYTVEELETHFKSSHLVNDKQCNENKTQCVMCLRNFRNEVRWHKCKFSCLECPVVPCVHYSYLMSYREQILNHSTKIRCLDCDYTTKRKEHLIAHVNREHLDYHPFTCNDCGTQFYTKLSLKCHITQFHQDLKCQYCDHEFNNKNLLKTHRELCKGITRMFSCKQCVASFDTETELQKHMSSHSDIVFPCTLCKREFTSETSLEEHHARVHNGIQYKKRRKFIECTLCDITFRNLKEMFEHEKLHDENEVFPCKVCSKSFKSLRKVYNHKQRHYSQRTKCLACKKILASSYFVQHQAVCPYLKKPPELSHVCDVCGKAFHTESTLRAHLQFHAKPLPCGHCNKFIKPTSMKRHIEAKHSKDTEKEKVVYKCRFCEYTAKKKLDLENHINKIHLKIKPYVCQICSKAFCGKSRLDEHEKIHTDSNVCFCTFCGKKFANKVCLKMHTRRHTGEKPYECNICFEKFRSSSIMKTHRLKKHQDKTIKCPLCDSMHHLAVEMRFHVKKIHWKSSERFDYKQIVPEEFYHLFEDQRLQKLGE